MYITTNVYMFKFQLSLLLNTRQSIDTDDFIYQEPLTFFKETLPCLEREILAETRETYLPSPLLCR